MLFVFQRKFREFEGSSEKGGFWELVCLRDEIFNRSCCPVLVVSLGNPSQRTARFILLMMKIEIGL